MTFCYAPVTGLLIFLVLVCKRSVWDKLKARIGDIIRGCRGGGSGSSSVYEEQRGFLSNLNLLSL